MSYAALKSNKNRNAVYYSKSCRCSVKRSLTTGKHKTQISTSYIENIMCQPRTLSSFLSLWLNHGRVWVCHCGSSLPLRTAATNLREVFILAAAYCISHRFHCRDSRPDQHFVRLTPRPWARAGPWWHQVKFTAAHIDAQKWYRGARRVEFTCSVLIPDHCWWSLIINKAKLELRGRQRELPPRLLRIARSANKHCWDSR